MISLEKETSKESSKQDAKQDTGAIKKHAAAGSSSHIHDAHGARKNLDISPQRKPKIRTESSNHSSNHYSGVLISLIVVLTIIVVYNFFVMQSVNKKVSEEVLKAKEAAKPAVISLLAIYPADCAACKDLTSVLGSVRNANVNITSSKDLVASSVEAKELVSTYAVAKLPTVIIKGDIDKLSVRGLEKRNDALVFVNPEPPYYDIANNDIIGDITATIIKDPSCIKCTDLDPLVTQLSKNGIFIAETKHVELSSSAGQQLIKRYNIKQVPSLIFSSDASAYPLIVQAWPQVGSVETDGTYVLREQSPPYIELPSRKLVGLVNVVFITDASCTTCYDVNDHRQILTGFGMSFGKEERVDVSSGRGKELVKQYSITKVPTVIISGDVQVYRGFDQIWKRVGSVEADGSYVFRAIEAMRGAVYKDLTSGTVVSAATS